MEKNANQSESRSQSIRRKAGIYTETLVTKIHRFTRREHKIEITTRIKQKHMRSTSWKLQKKEIP